MAAEGLGQSGDLSDLRPWLRSLASDLEPELRATSARAILRLQKYMPQTLHRNSLTWAQSAMRSPAAAAPVGSRHLGDIPGEEAVTLLGQLLRDSESKVRRGSARALGRHREESAFSTLRGAQRQRSDTRLATIAALGIVAKELLALGSSSAISQLSLADRARGGPANGNRSASTACSWHRSVGAEHSSGGAGSVPEQL